MRCLSECHNIARLTHTINEQTPNHLRTRFAEPERKQPAASSSPSLTPSHYDTKPAPARPQDAYGRPHPSPAGRLSPSGHGPYGAVMSPPPPTGGPRPNPVQNRPPPISRPPPSPAPNEGGADPTLLPLFRAVDKDRTSQGPSLHRSRVRLANLWRSCVCVCEQAPASSQKGSSARPSSTATGRPSTRTRCA